MTCVVPAVESVLPFAGFNVARFVTSKVELSEYVAVMTNPVVSKESFKL